MDAYLAALRILKYRFNSEAEIRRKLRSKKFDAAAIDTAIERLRSENWIDDERFAGAFVRTRAAKRVGRNRIVRELRAVGIDANAAERSVAENLDHDRELESLHALCAKRARILARRHGDDFAASEEGRNKLAVYLLNQGYDAALVRVVVKEFDAADDLA